MQSNTKPQFGNWLIEQVRNRQYGLCWVGTNRFKVPWKHNSRNDCSDEDTEIFRAWAVVSGKIRVNPHDKAKWKTNFRCALNNLKHQFEMIDDRSKEKVDPHKVYQIIRTEYNYETRKEEDTIINPDYPMIHNIYNTANLHDQQNDMECDDILNHRLTVLDLNHQPDGQYWGHPSSCSNPAAPDMYPIQPLPEMPPSENIPPVPAQQTYYPGPNGTMVSPMVPLQPSIYDLEITVHYRKKEVLKTQVLSPRVQLHYQCEFLELDTTNVCLPSTEELLDQKQVHYTKRILDSIQKGLGLEVRNTGIYGNRQGMCHVYASSKNPLEIQNPEPRKLQQNTEELLLSFEKYTTDLNNYRGNKGGSPDYTVYLCFGEKFPDEKPQEKKLIVVTVVPLICRYFCELAQQEGASSLHDTISLQISNNSLFDLISATFSLPTAD